MQIIRRVVAKISIGMAGTDWKFFRTLSISGGGGGGKETTRRAVSNDGKLFESTRLDGSDDP